MKNGAGQLSEIYLDSSARIVCPPELIPSPGQYLLAHAGGSDSPMAVPLFFSGPAPDGFRCAPLPGPAWMPGTPLDLRGPLGHGFSIPDFARKVALVAFDGSPARLRGLIPPALKQNAEIVLLSNSGMQDIPEAVEIQPLQALMDIYQWADYAAFDVERANWTEKTGRSLRRRPSRVPSLRLRWVAST